MLSSTVSQSLPSLFSGVLTIIGTVTIMLLYCWQLVLLSFATVFLTVIATKVLSKKVREFSRKRQMLLGQLNGTVEEMVSGYRTSNVDTRTEKAIQDAMHSVMQNRTSIVIAHRLSTIRDADMIVVMDHGRIVESGDHNTLLARKGKYYELYMTQYAGAAI